MDYIFEEKKYDELSSNDYIKEILRLKLANEILIEQNKIFFKKIQAYQQLLSEVKEYIENKW